MRITVNLERGIIHLSGWRGYPHSNIAQTTARLFASANRHPERSFLDGDEESHPFKNKTIGE